jgi:hypothetical protein
LNLSGISKRLYPGRSAGSPIASRLGSLRGAEFTPTWRRSGDSAPLRLARVRLLCSNTRKALGLKTCHRHIFFTPSSQARVRIPPFFKIKTQSRDKYPVLGFEKLDHKRCRPDAGNGAPAKSQDFVGKRRSAICSDVAGYYEKDATRTPCLLGDSVKNNRTGQINILEPLFRISAE